MKKFITVAALALAIAGLAGSAMGQGNEAARGAKGGYRGCLVEVTEVTTLHFFSGTWSTDYVYTYDASAKGDCAAPVNSSVMAVDFS